VKDTPSECMKYWLNAKADEFQRNMKYQSPGYDMPRYQAEASAQNAFNDLDNIGLIEALDFGRLLIEADQIK